MSSLINLVISFLMSFLFGHQIEESKTAQLELQQPPIEIIQQLKIHQKVLEC